MFAGRLTEIGLIFSSLGFPPSFLAASPLVPHSCSRPAMTQKKNKILLAVYSLTLVIRYHFIRHILIPNDYYLRSALVLSL